MAITHRLISMRQKLASMNISLPAALRIQLEKKLARHSYSSASEYVRELVRRDLQREAIEKVDTLLLEGLKAGPATPMTEGDWEDLRRIASRLSKRRHVARTPPTSRRKARSR
jgi:antitoxin ParD1/3/4